MNPFINFRKTEEEEPDTDPVPTVVTKYYDGKEAAAVCLFDDGHLSKADFYQAGPNGFVIAKWLALDGQAAELELEVQA